MSFQRHGDGKPCRCSVLVTRDRVVRRRRRSRCSLSRSTSSPPRCPSPSATSSTCASRKATRPYRRPSVPPTPPGRATTPTTTCERSSRNSACRTTRATSTSTWPPDAASDENCADSSLSWYPVVVNCHTAIGLPKPKASLALQDCRETARDIMCVRTAMRDLGVFVCILRWHNA